MEIPPTTCLFAHPKYNHNFDTIDENIEHMFKQHGLYIPERKYLIDKQGLLEYLGEKLGLDFVLFVIIKEELLKLQENICNKRDI